jgi:CBS domain containing-hemolysin-like protein
MTPRTDLEMLPDDAPATAVLDASDRTGLTRFPVYLDDHDEVVGMVHVKDVLIRDPDDVAGLSVHDLRRPIKAVPESRDLEHLLGDMRADRSHAVLVVDEFGAMIGLVTLEDVLEELVGEVRDEMQRRVE